MDSDPSMKKYLAKSEIIDWDDPGINELASHLSEDCDRQQDVAKNCFEWVRDRIMHSRDHKLNPVTCRASDVLKHGTGDCYSKSHLLAALLRANSMPAGLCYQRLSRDENGNPYCLHSLNAVYLDRFGWYRIDARGNKPGVDAQFCPPIEKLAFVPSLDGERDLPGIFAEPLKVVIETLARFNTYEAVYDNLPDLEVLSPAQSGEEKCR